MNRRMLFLAGIFSLVCGAQAARSSAISLRTVKSASPAAPVPVPAASADAQKRTGTVEAPVQKTPAQKIFAASLAELEDAVESQEKPDARKTGKLSPPAAVSVPKVRASSATKDASAPVVTRQTSVPVSTPGPKPIVTPGQVLSPRIEPTDGTIFEKSLTVNVWCDDENVKIHFTTNGMTPTAASPLYRRFRVYGKSVVKAAVETSDGKLGPVVSARYAQGTCSDPEISPADGTTFRHSGNVVAISWSGSDGTLRYTLDGSEPTRESAEYTEPFTVDDSVVVKAKAFGDRFFDSRTAAASYTRKWVTVGTPVVKVPATFSGAAGVASITGEEGARFRYTLDGTEPNDESALYDGPFEVKSSVTIKARAFRDDCRASAVASASTRKIWCLGDALNAPDRTFTTNAVGWVRDAAVSKDGVESLRSVSPGNNKVYGKHVRTSLATTVSGKGTVSFWWKTSCEKDDLHEWDHAEFSADGKIWRLDGITDWQKVEHEFTTDGEHVLTWSYLKDDFGKEGEDCAWVDMFSWTPAE